MTNKKIANTRLIFSLLILLLTLSSCAQSKQEFPSGCDVTDMLLQISDLPVGARISTSEGPLTDSTINSAGSVIHYSSKLASQEVYWYSSERYAVRKYEEELSYAQLLNKENQPLPFTMTKSDLFADNYNIVCGRDAGTIKCRYVGRYKKYVTTFTSDVSGETSVLTTYDKLITVIDSKINSCK